jgi:two-component system, NtrC family, sensor kinase
VGSSSKASAWQSSETNRFLTQELATPPGEIPTVPDASKMSLPKKFFSERLSLIGVRHPVIQMNLLDSPVSMHYQDSSIFSARKGKVLDVNSTGRSNIVATPITTTRIWFSHITRRLSIHQKIAYGYILSISLAVMGTGVGLIVGEYYDDKGVEQFSVAHERYERLDQLEKAVLQVKLHQQQLMIAAEKNTLQPKEIQELQESIAEANTQLSLLKVNLKTYQGIPGDYIAELKTFMQVGEQAINSYTELLQLLVQKVNTSNSTSSKIQGQKQILQEIINIKQSTNVEKISQRLEHLVHTTVTQEEQAKATFRRAKVLRLVIIVVSMILSVAIAMALALYTSRAIAHPIQAVTKIAKQTTEEGNFALQAPVMSDDEIGVLATSLNQLIQQVAAQIRELKQAQAQLIQGEKMSSLGQMVAGIAHEINNPVNFIYANLDYANNYTEDLLELISLYQQYYPQPVPEIKNKIEHADVEFIREDLPKIISSMHRGAERIRQIILSLRTFCHLDEAEMKSVNINQGLDKTLLLLNHRINKGIEAIKQYGSLPAIECYPAQLNQVFWHIISNSIDELLAHKDLLSQPQILIQTQLVSSEQIEVRIRDNGMGIDPEIIDKIFDPFFTTKPVGEGTGMGLAICYQIVEKHRGTIQVFSELGSGTEFVVTLPIEHHSTHTADFNSQL